MNLKEALNTRRSIRSFQDKPVDRELLEALVRAGANAPSARGAHQWKFTVIESRALIDQLAGLIAKKLNLNPAQYNFYGATALILVSDQRDDINWLANCAVALENILLLAHGLGLGGVWINQLRTLCDDGDIRNLLTEWKIPENHLVGGIAAVGYAKGDAPAVEKPLLVDYF